jgi:hypothetical protein
MFLDHCGTAVFLDPRAGSSAAALTVNPDPSP